MYKANPAWVHPVGRGTWTYHSGSGGTVFMACQQLCRCTVTPHSCCRGNSHVPPDRTMHMGSYHRAADSWKGSTPTRASSCAPMPAVFLSTGVKEDKNPEWTLWPKASAELPGIWCMGEWRGLIAELNTCCCSVNRFAGWKQHMPGPNGLCSQLCHCPADGPPGNRFLSFPTVKWGQRQSPPHSRAYQGV